MASKPRVAVISCGGTISAKGANSLDVTDYNDTGQFLQIGDLLGRFPELAEIAEAIPIQFQSVGSSAIGPQQWLELVSLVHHTVATEHGVSGVVIAHGTATLEETAYFFNLTLKTDVPVVLVGSQRPPTALSSDVGMNLVDAFRAVVSPDARGKGVLVILNDEVHAARDVTKTSTLRLHTFRTPDFGMLGQVEGDGVHFYRAPLRRTAPNTEFDVRGLSSLPRVDVCYSYAGADGAVIDALVIAGARGIVSAGFALGVTTPAERNSLQRAIAKGLVVVQSSRVWSGRVAPQRNLLKMGMVFADNLNPQKARILLMLALTRTTDRATIQNFFEQY